MIQELLDVKASDSFSEMCARMGAFLGMEEPLPENAMRRAIEDEEYANNLIACRDAPGFLKALINDPQNDSFAPKNDSVTNAQLIGRATKAFVKWGKAGFSVVDQKVLESRENACLGCENLMKPEKVLQKLMSSKSKDQIGKRATDCTCKACGCVISKKIRIPTEACPVEDKNRPGFNKWGEAINK